MKSPKNQKLVEKAAVFQAFFNDLPDAAMLVSLSREYLVVNPAAERLFGYSAEEMRGLPARALYQNEEDYVRFGQDRFSLSASGATIPLVAELRRANGTTFTGESIGSLIRDDKGEPLGFLAIARNVSEKRKVDSVLSELFEISSNQSLTSEERIQAILEVGSRYFELPIGIVSHISNQQYRVEFCVPLDVGLEKGQVFALKDTLCELTVGARKPQAIHSVLDSEHKTHPCYEKFQTKAYIGAPLEVNGEPYGTVCFSGGEPREIRFQPFEIEIQRHFAVWIGNELSRLQSLFRLVSTRREAIEQRMRAEKANAAKSEFLAVMSHELRTPMTGLLGNLDLLESGGLSEEQQGFCDLVRESAQGLMSILNDILDLSKIEAGHLDLEETPVRIRELLADVMQLFRPLVEEKGLSFDLFVDDQVPERMMGDSVRLKQLLSNLLSNAVKFTSQGGVALSLSSAASKGEDDQEKITLSSRPKRQSAKLDLVFEVKDTGPGIEQEKLKHIFDSFTQADVSTTRRFGGTGLGLSICRQLAEVMRGRIEVESKPGEGALFRVTLSDVIPVSDDTPCLPQSPVSYETQSSMTLPKLPPAAPTDRPLKVLLAEDNAVNARLITTMMTRMHFEVTTVNTGVKVLEELKRDRFDAILMDMHMPEMDGVEATKIIRSGEGPLAEIPIVALTADAITANRAAYENIGLSAFLTKPINWNVLEQTLRSAVAGESSLPTGPAAQTDLADAKQNPAPGTLPTAQAAEKNGAPEPTAQAPEDAALPQQKTGPAPLVDEAYLLDMLDLIGRESLDDLLGRANGSLEQALTDYETAVAQNDLDTQREVLHRLKGLSGTLGGRRLSELSKQGEDALRQEQPVPFPPASVRLLIRATNTNLTRFQKKHLQE
ncbi:ATP-binding protein [Rhodovibrionaceae bacterium A322]